MNDNGSGVFSRARDSRGLVVKGSKQKGYEFKTHSHLVVKESTHTGCKFNVNSGLV